MRATSFLMLLVAGAGVGCSSDEPSPSKPTFRAGGGVTDQTTCGDLGLGSYSRTIEAPASRTYGLDEALGGRNTVTLVGSDGMAFDWSASIAIEAVIVRGGSTTKLYTFTPGTLGGFGLTTGVSETVSHVDFCFDYALAVTKTAGASFTRSYAWAIDKRSPISELALAVGETVRVPYTVDVKVTGATDGGYRADGTVRIHNPAPFAATITHLTDEVHGIPTAIDCGIALPFELEPDATLVCTYGAALPSPVDTSSFVYVNTTGPVGPGSARAFIDFDRAVMVEIDRCIDVTDERVGALGHPCSDASFSYSLDVGPYTCPGGESFVNHATFIASDTGATGMACWAIAVTVTWPIVGRDPS